MQAPGPRQPLRYCCQASRIWLLVRLWQLRHFSSTFALNRSKLSGTTSVCLPRFSRNPRNLRSQTLPTPLLVAFTCSRSCFSIQPWIERHHPFPRHLNAYVDIAVIRVPAELMPAPFQFAI